MSIKASSTTVHKDEPALGMTATTDTIQVGSRTSIDNVDVELKKHFNIWSTLGLVYAASGAPIGIGAYLALVIGVGGSTVFIYGFITAAIFQIILVVSMAELAGAFPHTTGQVHWTSSLASPKYARVLSYWTGAFAASAWFFAVVATYLFSSTFIWTLVTIIREDFVVTTWQIYLVVLVVAIVAVLLNTILFRFYSIALRLFMVFVNILAVLIFISLLVRTNPKRSAKEVFTVFTNNTGWSSDGFVFLLGLLPGVASLAGFDTATHMTHELPNPKVQVPQIMIGGTVITAISCLPMIFTYMFCVTNPSNLLTPIGGSPMVQLLVDSLDSKPLVIVIMVGVIFCYVIAGAGATTTCSRIVWGLANERHLFLSEWLIKLTGRHLLPKNAIFALSILGCLFLLLNFGTTTALNAMLGSSIVCFYISFIIPLMCVLLNQNALNSVHDRSFDLGKWSQPIGLISVSWLFVMSAVQLFPIYVPVTSTSMNYTSAVCACVGLIFTVNWFLYARTRYTVPNPNIYEFAHRKAVDEKGGESQND